MRTRGLVAKTLLIGVIVAAGGVAQVQVAAPAYGGSCTKQTGVSVRDANTGWTWTTRWWCGNRGGATMYGDANTLTPTAYMDSTWSWFVCWRLGAPHAGGNSVWYYSLGDRAASGMAVRGKWGYMPAVNVWTSTDPWPGMAQCPVGYSPPLSTNGYKTVLFLHGYSFAGSHTCTTPEDMGYWDDAVGYYDSHGWDVTQLKTVKYYTYDYGCDLDATDGLLANEDTPIQELGRRLALTIYRGYSRFGDTVDVIAHSMGGLVIRAAISGTSEHLPGFPPYIYVEDVSTLGTPHNGAGDWYPCLDLGPFGPDFDNTQCHELDPDSSFIAWIQSHPNPQASQQGSLGGTDWTLIGAGDDGGVDGLVASESALDTGATAHARHKFLYQSGQGLEHSVLPDAIQPGPWTARYCNYYNLCDMANPDTWIYTTTADAPVVVASLGNYYSSAW